MKFSQFLNGFLLAIGLCCAWGAYISIVLHAQRQRPPQLPAEVPESPQWVINLKAVGGEKAVHIQVIETSGVCLYVYQSADSSPYGSIAAVAKSLLPIGASCQ